MNRKWKIITATILIIIACQENFCFDLNNTNFKAKDIQSRIFRGTVAEEGQLPWQVIYWYEEKFCTSYCGGVLITSEFVLTAAHCLYPFRPKAPAALHLGTISRINLPAIRITSGLSVLYHDEYQPKTFLFDIALIKLPQPVSFSNLIQAIPLSNNQVCPGEKVVTSGWGKEGNHREGSKLLKYINLKTISNAECKTMYPPNINQGVVCALGVTDQPGATCSGDSGSGLVREISGKPILVGIVSFGNSRGCENNYGMGFTRVAYYEPWINENVKQVNWIGIQTKCPQPRCNFTWPFQFLCWFF